MAILKSCPWNKNGSKTTLRVDYHCCFETSKALPWASKNDLSWVRNSIKRSPWTKNDPFCECGEMLNGWGFHSFKWIPSNHIQMSSLLFFPCWKTDPLWITRSFKQKKQRSSCNWWTYVNLNSLLDHDARISSLIIPYCSGAPSNMYGRGKCLGFTDRHPLASAQEWELT